VSHVTGVHKLSEVTKARLTKESRSYPNLIFMIEKYEVCLIKYSKQCKVILDSIL
jgi:hypothetical protein